MIPNDVYAVSNAELDGIETLKNVEVLVCMSKIMLK